MSFLVGLILIVICLGLQAFFAALEIALLSCDRIYIRHLSDRGSLKARWVNDFLARPVNYLGTTMIGVNLAVVISASITAHLTRLFVSERAASFVATGLLWPLILLLGEFIPMSLALAYPNQMSLWGVMALKAAYGFFYPFVRLIDFFSRLINRLLGGSQDASESSFTRDELRLLFKGIGEKIFDKSQERMIRGVFDFHRVRASEIMVPLKEMVSSSVTSTVGHLKRRIFDSAFSRIPIYQGLPSRIVGVVHALDLIGLEDDVSVEKIMRPSIKVDQSKPVSEIFKMLKMEQNYMAMVVDHQNRVIGLVTVEDILEEVVGEIEDEYDKEVA
ncbi:MAG: HlyC/CorC family transporter [Chlamydiae bacterium]|nr:HlyC/CorC family transporter [Chlamydiota bacterium]MBI3266959.1 HlyC/CorC family transporter [Chlamydiota bacterium]